MSSYWIASDEAYDFHSSVFYRLVSTNFLQYILVMKIRLMAGNLSILLSAFVKPSEIEHLML